MSEPAEIRNDPDILDWQGNASEESAFRIDLRGPTLKVGYEDHQSSALIGIEVLFRVHLEWSRLEGRSIERDRPV